MFNAPKATPTPSSRPEDGDGIVPLDSARWPTGTETLLRGDHELHREPATTLIIKQILLERLDRLSAQQ